MLTINLKCMFVVYIYENKGVLSTSKKYQVQFVVGNFISNFPRPNKSTLLLPREIVEEKRRLIKK